MTAALKMPHSPYAATLLKKLISPQASEDPTAADLARLSGPMYEIAFAVVSEGRDKSARQNRLRAEIAARAIDPLMPEIDSADPCADLSTLQFSSGWTAFDLADVMAEELPSITWIVKPYLPRPSVVVFFGKPKAMKSLLVLDMALHIAGGLDWLTNASNGADGIQVSKARVVWLDLENGAATSKRRMKAIATALGMSQVRDQLIAFSMPNPWPDLSNVENAGALITRIQALGDVGVLVIDHLGQVFGPVDENSLLPSQVMAGIRQISEACNVAVVLIHHAKKGGGKDSGDPADQLRGSGAIMAGVDGAFLVERDKTERNQLKVIPVAVRGPEAPNVSAEFSYDRDANLDLTQPHFWQLQWRSNSVQRTRCNSASFGHKQEELHTVGGSDQGQGSKH